MSLITPLALLVATLHPTLPTDAPQFEVHLYADWAAVQSGGAADLVVELKITEEWRLYHPLILDVGRPLSISFNVPAGAAVGPLRFPRPLLGAQGEQEYLAFEERLLVLTRLTLPPDLTATPLEITARVQGQASRGSQHVPIAGEATLSLAVSDEPGAPANQDLFAEARDALPQSLAEADYLAGSRLLVSHTQIPLGGQASVVAVIRVKPGHHIQDRNPGVEGLIASRLFIESPPGLKSGQQIWPQPKLRHMQFFGKVREQSGDIVIQVPFTLAAEELSPGPVRLAALFEYQTCSDAGVCFAPNMAAGSVEFKVVPAGTPAVKNDDPVIAKLATSGSPTPEASGGSTGKPAPGSGKPLTA